MKNFSELNIAFYTKYEASVRPVFSRVDERILTYEVALFSAFTLRQMSNLRGSLVDQFIAKALFEARDTLIDGFNIGNYVPSSNIEIKVPSLVKYRGRGDKCFYGEFDFINTSQGITPTIKIKPIGFGIFGKDVNYYALQSINILLHYFTNKYSSDPPRKYVFSDASNLCGREYLSGNIANSITEGQTVTLILRTLFPK